MDELGEPESVDGRAVLRSRNAGRRKSSAWVYDTVRAGFREGFYSEDHMLSENELMRFFNVTRASVREALERLTEEGILSRAPRRGTTPRGTTVHVTVDNDVTFHISGTAAISAEHREVVRSSEIVNASIFVAKKLGVAEGAQVRVDDSFATVNGEPFAYNMLYSQIGQIPARGMAGEEPYLDKIEALGFEIVSVESTFEAIKADPVSAELLLVPEGSPLLLRILTIVGEDDARLLSIIRMRGDRAIVHTSR